MLKTTLLFFVTALCEIIGCFLPWLWLKRGASVWWLLPAAASLALFVWLLTLHPAAGRSHHTLAPRLSHSQGRKHPMISQRAVTKKSRVVFSMRFIWLRNDK
ncbi:membrane protein [Salmonella enterica subsp. enterica serovar Bareilly str. CFSAN000201]|nr:membrane protein [Salmonella enterica subsp. enterica serovar Bareilly str. CFSAN000201]